MIATIDKIYDPINTVSNDIAQKLYYDQIASFCRMNGIRSISELYHFDQSGPPIDPKRSIPKNSRKIVVQKSTLITPTPNSLVSETPRGNECTAEEKRNR